MKFQAATCPQCSGALQVPADREIIKCMYCGTDISVKEAIGTNGANVSNIIFLAKKAEESENFAEAYSLYSRVLEVDPENIDAWFGKGFSAGMQSNLRELRFDELIVCYETGLSFCTDENKLASMKTKLCLDVLMIATAAYNLSLSHTMEFISVDDVIHDHGIRCIKIIAFCEYAWDHDSSQSGLNELIVNISKRCSGMLYLGESTRAFFSKKIKQYQTPEMSAEEKKLNDKSGGGSFWFIVILFAIIYYFATR